MNRAFNRKKDKSWMHTPEALAKHYIPYNAKFLGNTEVEAPKGTEVVKDAVRKLKVTPVSQSRPQRRRWLKVTWEFFSSRCRCLEVLDKQFAQRKKTLLDGLFISIISPFAETL